MAFLILFTRSTRTAIVWTNIVVHMQNSMRQRSGQRRGTESTCKRAIGVDLGRRGRFIAKPTSDVPVRFYLRSGHLAVGTPYTCRRMSSLLVSVRQYFLECRSKRRQRGEYYCEYGFLILHESCPCQREEPTNPLSTDESKQ